MVNSLNITTGNSLFTLTFFSFFSYFLCTFFTVIKILFNLCETYRIGRIVSVPDFSLPVPPLIPFSELTLFCSTVRL